MINLKFYEKVKRSRKGFTPQADTCRDAEGNLLMDKGEVLDRWKQFFNERMETALKRNLEHPQLTNSSRHLIWRR